MFFWVGIHAREWISPAMATYLMNELIVKNATQYLDNLNIHILPSANPDGYMHSRDSDRLWRKTRSDTGSILGCKGVDGNRNWDFHFDGNNCILMLNTFISLLNQLLYRNNCLNANINTQGHI